MAAKKQDTLHKACAAVGVPVPAALPADGGQCFELHSVHGVLDCDSPHLGGKALEKAPPDDPKELCFLVYGTTAPHPGCMKMNATNQNAKGKCAGHHTSQRSSSQRRIFKDQDRSGPPDLQST